MNSRMAQSGTTDEDDHVDQKDEKTSFYQKVKAKARRMKKSIGNKMHGGHEEDEQHGHDDDNVDDEEEVELDEEQEQLEVHGAPMKESAAASSFTEQPRADLGHSSSVEETPIYGSSDPLHEEKYPTKVTHPTEGDASMSDKDKSRVNVNAGHSSSPMEEDAIQDVYQPEVAYPPRHAGAASSHLDNDPNPLRTTGPENYQTGVTYPPTDAALSEQQGANLGHLSPMEKHPHGSEEQPSSVNLGHLSLSDKDPRGSTELLLAEHSPKDYQTKVTDPTYGGGKEVDVDPIVSSFGKMEVKSDELEVRSRETSSPIGSQDHFSSDNLPIPPINTMETSGNSLSVPLSQSMNDESHLSLSDKDPHGSTELLANHSPEEYQTKVIDPTYGGGKEVDVDPIVSSFGKIEVKSDELEVRSRETSLPTGSQDQFSSDNSPIPPINTVEASGNPLSVPLSQSMNDESNESQQATTNVDEHHPTNQGSSYTEKLSYATSAIADSAISAKDAVASKLGLGSDSEGSHTHDTSRSITPTTDTDVVAGTNDTPITTPTSRMGMGEGTVEYGKTIASTVYNTVAGAGSTVASKIPGMGSSGEGTDNVDTHSRDTSDADVGADAVTDTTTSAKLDMGSGADKGVPVKGYLAEKFSPGEGDKALSEMITGAFHKSDEDKQKEHSNKVEETMERVTEPEKVATHLETDESGNHGSGDHGSGVVVGDGGGSGIGMVDRFKGSVAYWFGGNTVDQTHPTSESHNPNTSNVEAHEHDSLGVSRHEGVVTAASHEDSSDKGM